MSWLVHSGPARARAVRSHWWRSTAGVLIVLGAMTLTGCGSAGGGSADGSVSPLAAPPSGAGTAVSRPAAGTPDRPVPSALSGSPNSPVSSAPAGAVFRLVVYQRAGLMATGVAPISVGSYQPVDPPHATPQQWATAVWVQQSTYPANPQHGTAYIYGHACHHHICSFTRLKDTHVGDTVRVTTAAGTLTYRVDRIGLSPKSASTLPGWAADSTVPDRLVLVTCEYEQGDTSLNDLVVAATLVHPAH